MHYLYLINGYTLCLSYNSRWTRHICIQFCSVDFGRKVSSSTLVCLTSLHVTLEAFFRKLPSSNVILFISFITSTFTCCREYFAWSSCNRVNFVSAAIGFNNLIYMYLKYAPICIVEQLSTLSSMMMRGGNFLPVIRLWLMKKNFSSRQVFFLNFGCILITPPLLHEFHCI